MATIGNVIRTLREQRGMTQEELAQQAGMQQSQLNRIELRSRPLDGALLRRLAAALHLSLDELYQLAKFDGCVDETSTVRFMQLEELYRSLPERYQVELVAIAGTLAGLARDGD